MQNDKFDSLENRVLFSTTLNASVINNVLQIVGSAKNDAFLITRDNGGSAVPAGSSFAAILNPDGTTDRILVHSQTSAKVVLPTGQFIHVEAKHSDFYFATGGITAITVDAGAGNDDVVISTNVKLPSTILGGDGNDTLEGSTKGDSIDGGAGNDQIFGGKIGTAPNTLLGGDGADTIFGSSEDDSIISPPDGARDQITMVFSSSQDLFAVGSEPQFGSEDIVLKILDAPRSTFNH
jgi:Ca2+-binding RTX toxin-like protein